MTRRPPIEPYYVQENDNLGEIAKTLRPAIEFTDEDLRRLSLAAKNLFSGRWHLGLGWLAKAVDRASVRVELSCEASIASLVRLAQLEVARNLGVSPVSAQDDVLKCRNSGVAHETTLGSFDGFVHSTIGVAATALEDDLERRGFPVWTIGGAVVPRTLFDAMHDAQAAACVIGRSA